MQPRCPTRHQSHETMKSVSVTLSPPDRGFHRVDRAISEVESVSRRKLLYVDDIDGDSCLLIYQLSGGQSGGLRETLDDHPRVLRSCLSTQRSARTGQRNARTLYAHVEHGQPLVDIIHAIERYALLYKRPIPFRDERMTVTVGGFESAIWSALADLPESLTVEIHRVGEYDPDVDGVLSLLTDRQWEALTVALESGYYDTAGRTTCEELAATLGCSPSTANDRIREAERRVMSAIQI